MELDRAQTHSAVEPFREIVEQEFSGLGLDTRFHELKECLRDRGSFVLREVIDPATVESHFARAEETYARYSARCAAEGVDIASAPNHWSTRRGWEGVAYAMRYGQLYPQWIADSFPGHSIYDLLDEGPLLPFLASFFSGPCRPSSFTHTRRIHPLRSRDGPTEFEGYASEQRWHVDAEPHGASRFTVNLWTPLQDCGVDRPGLRAAILPVDEARALSGYDPRSGRFDPDAVSRLGDGGAALAGAPIHAPVMRRGDVFVFAHWTIHSTYLTPGMTRSRLSAELRFESDSAEFP